jgi:hypothetical protein
MMVLFCARILFVVGALSGGSTSAWAMHKALLAAKLHRLEMRESGGDGSATQEEGKAPLGVSQGVQATSDMKIHWKALGLTFPHAGSPARVDVESMNLLRAGPPPKDVGLKAPLKLPSLDLPWPEFEEFNSSFVVVPEGFLPDGLPMGGFEAAKYPVTRVLWNLILPEHAVSLGNCPTCPVTDVVWDHEDGSPAEVQFFLERLNARASNRGCVYDLPTDPQLWYLIRGDVTGKSVARYSVAKVSGAGSSGTEFVSLDDENVDPYLIHDGNSAGRPRPVGTKRTNAFGLELGNVWRLSKDPFYPARPDVGRTARGGSWFFDLHCASSRYKTIAYAGDRQDSIGFSLVRRCGSSPLK